MADEKIAFATVGTTSFDRLVETLCRKPLLKLLERLGYTKLVIQIGRGIYEPEMFSTKNFSLEYYRYKDSLTEDLKNASLVISHAGAGCIIETLRQHRPLIVVVNEKLMHNHQFELAKQLAIDNHLIYCICDHLKEVLETKDLTNLDKYNTGNPQLFADFLDELLGVQT